MGAQEFDQRAKDPDSRMSNATCPRCGREVGSNAPHALCSACLLEAALSENDTFDQAAPGQPQIFGDYELLGEIAHGGMGVVYKARQSSLNRVVALKMVLGGKLASAADLQRFRAEAEAVAHLDHPSIVPIYEIGEQQGQQYFTMRLVEGGSLAELLSREPNHFTEREAAQLIATAARAIHCAHQHGILQRDLKPANILIDAQKRPHITDFGLAKNIKTSSDITLSGTVLGTPAYMAPEQAAGQVKEVSTATDVYSLGAILYELLVGRPPFQADTVLETLRKVTDEEPARPGTINHRFDRDLETICLKCLEKDPPRRYGSAEALADDLERWLKHEPILARRVSTPERIWKYARRRPALAALVTTIVLALIAITAVSTTTSVRIAASERKARLEAEKARRESENSRQTAAFLKQMIEDVWPSAARGKDTEIFKDALEQTAARLRVLQGQPEVEVELRLTLARAYEGLGLFREQEMMSREAARMATAHWGERSVLSVKCLESQAQALFKLARPRESIALYEKVIAMQKALYGAEHPSLAWFYSRLADVYLNSGNRDASEQLWLEALPLQEKSGDDAGRGYTLLCLGRIRFERGDVKAAEKKMLEALELQKKVRGPEHPSVAQVLVGLARIAEHQGDLAHAESLFRQTLAMRIKAMGAVDHQVAHTMTEIARVQQKLRDFEGATRTLDEALVIERKAVGEEHQFVAEILVQRARLEVARADSARAKEVYQQALAMQEKVLGPDHPQTAITRTELADLLRP